MTPPALYRFGPCELDEARRSLTSQGREIKLQPRVFDLLLYLVRHRERVVSKDELLDALWPGTVVVDNALQRVVSLARSALAEVGLGEAVRTYARHGYRFCIENCDEAPLPDPSAAEPAATTSPYLDQARAANRASDWAGACAAFADADRFDPLPPEAVEEWGRAAICAGLGAGAIAALERAINQRTAEDDSVGAARVTLLLVQIQIDRRQSAIARGLLQRASRWLDGQSAIVERGHFAWISSRFALGSGDPQAALKHADEAYAVGRALRNPDVECLGLAYRGHAMMIQGDVAAGLALHEEAAALIRVSGVTPWVAGWILCTVLYSARYRCDWLRAAQFAEAFREWSRACRMPAFPGTCQLHRAAVLSVQGDLVGAAAEVRAAAASLADVAPWAEGDAYCVLGDIQLSHGDIDGAEASFRHAHALGWDPQPGLARLHLMTGQPRLAQRGLERALEDGDWTQRERRGQLMCMLVRASIAAGDTERAREAIDALEADPQMVSTEALKAMYADGQADMALHVGEPAAAAAHLRRAIRHWRDVASLIGEADARLRLADCLIAMADAAGAELEIHAVESNPVVTDSTGLRQKIAALRQAMRRGTESGKAGAAPRQRAAGGAAR